MKKFALITIGLFFISTLGCSSFFLKGKATKIVGNKKGVVYLRDGREIPFSQSSIEIDDEIIRIKSNFIHQSVLWPNAKTLVIENQEPIKDAVIKQEEKK